MIDVEHLRKRYGDAVVVDDVSFSVADGDSVALWGPNGAGKTTIVRCILGLAAYEGTIRVGGLDVRTHGKAVRRLLGHVPQELAFYDTLSVQETLELSAELRGVSKSRIDAVLGLVELGDHRGKAVGALSGGMKQRLGIGVALLADPPVLLLDEPTSNLDIASRETVIALLTELREEGRTIVLTTHHLEEVGMLVDRVLSMEGGKITIECAPSELAERLELLSWLHLVIDDAELQQALDVLAENGFSAKRNGQGVVVEVPAQRKADALSLLQARGLEPRDFEVWR